MVRCFAPPIRRAPVPAPPEAAPGQRVCRPVPLTDNMERALLTAAVSDDLQLISVVRCFKHKPIHAGFGS
jgi:hypothetical protein